jgi:hypothetical protein
MKRKIPTLVIWYLPVIDHLKRVFSNPRDTEIVRWDSVKCRENDEEIRHPMDELSGKCLIFSIQNFQRRVEI